MADNNSIVKRFGVTVIWTASIEKSIEFYSTIGLKLEKEEHEEGPVHYACEISGVHFAIFDAEGHGAAPNRRKSGSTQIGFVVDKVDETYDKLISLGYRPVWEPAEFPWGRSAMVLDPDNRPVELFKEHV